MKKLGMHQKKDLLFFILTFSLSAVLFYAVRMGVDRGVNADETSNYFVGKDFLNGNFFLKGWNFSTGLFLLPAYVAAVLTMIFGYHDGTFYLMASMNYALLVSLPFYAVYRIARAHKIRHPLIYVVVTALLIFVPRADMLYNSGTHVLSVAVSIAFFYLFYKLSKIQLKVSVYIGYFSLCLVMGILAATNTMFLYSAVVPIILTGMCISVQERNRRSGLRYIVPGMLAAICQIIISNLWNTARGGSRYGNTPTTFVQRENLWDSLLESLYGMLRLFGIDIWAGEVISRRTAVAFIGACALLKLVVEWVKFFRSPKDRHAAVLYMFFMMALVNLAAYASSTLALMYRSTHLIFPCLIGIAAGGVLAWIENIHSRVSSGTWKGYLTVAAILFAAMLPGFSLKQPQSYEMQAAKYLTDHGYRNGYGGFWSATTTMYYAGYYGNESMRITPLASFNTERLGAYRWMVTDDMLGQKANFFICSKQDREQYAITDDKIMDTFGRWDKKLELDGGILLYLWEDGFISTNGLWGSGSYNRQMELSDPGMLQQDAAIRIGSSDIMYGPYLNLEKGIYNLIVEADNSSAVTISVTAGSGSVEIAAFTLKDGRNHYTFSLDAYSYDVEFVIHGTQELEGTPLIIKNIEVGRADSMDYLSGMYVADGLANISDAFNIELMPGERMYGPYFNLEAGSYELDIPIIGTGEDMELLLTSNRGRDRLNAWKVQSGGNRLFFYLPDAAADVEFVLDAAEKGITMVQAVQLKKLYEIDLTKEMNIQAKEAISPEITLEKGIYCLTVVAGRISGNTAAGITGIGRDGTMAEHTLKKGENSVIFNIDEKKETVQIRIFGFEGDWPNLEHIKIERLNLIEYIQKMQLSSDSMCQTDDSVIIQTEDMLFGPYVNLAQGRYCMCINVLESNTDAQVIVRDSTGDIAFFPLALGKNIFDFQLEADAEDVEFIIKNEAEGIIHVDSLAFAAIQGV